MSFRIANRIKTVKVDNAGAAGYLSLVTGVTDRKIRVTAFHLVGAGAATVKFQTNDPANGNAKADLTGAMTLATGVPHALAGSGDSPLLQAGRNLDLGINVTGAVQVSGFVSYTLEPFK